MTARTLQAPIVMEKQRRGSLPIWCAAAGAASAAIDMVVLHAIGVTFTWGEHDATLVNGAFMAVNYAVLGFLVGWMIEARRRERESARLLAESAESLARIRARLAESEKRAAIGELSTAVAHEVRNPLGVIRSAAQSLAETAADDEAKQACGFIVTEIDRLSNVVTSLLALARPLTLERRSVDVTEICGRARLLASEVLRRRDVTLVDHVPSGLPALEADPDLLCQVVLGLVVNAADASPASSAIDLEASAKERQVEIAVTDRGPGVPAELREKVFEPFFTTRTSGVGLGLAIARRIIEAHHGKIDVVPNPEGAGARFFVRLPA